MKTNIQANGILKYIPKKLHKDIIGCDKFKNSIGYTYNVIFKDNETTIFADSIAGLKWACKEIIKGRKGVIYA